MALREVGLAVGEPPTTKGYTPTVFAQLPRLLERAGNSSGPGSITGVYTVLVEGDDMNDPIADAVRAIVDGHIVLARSLAERGHFPAIDVPSSISRVMNDVVDSEGITLSLKVRELLATYREAEDLVAIGAYRHGSVPRLDEALKRMPELEGFLRQSMNEHTEPQDIRPWLLNIWKETEA
jgi:flagellum-specific ATP synthase